MKVRVQMTVIEGWSDQPSARLSESVQVEWEAPAVPRVGDEVETGYGGYQVKVVFWSLDGSPPVIRLDAIYTLSEPMEVVLAALGAGSAVHSAVPGAPDPND